jgi:hypothetical protein
VRTWQEVSWQTDLSVSRVRAQLQRCATKDTVWRSLGVVRAGKGTVYGAISGSEISLVRQGVRAPAQLVRAVLYGSLFQSDGRTVIRAAFRCTTAVVIFMGVWLLGVVGLVV